MKLSKRVKTYDFVGHGRKHLVFVAVVVGHVSVFVAVIHIRPQTKAEPRELVSTFLVFETARAPERSRTSPHAKFSQPPAESLATRERIDSISTAPLALPSIDWQEERERTAGGLAARSAPQSRLSKSKETDLPELGERGRVFVRPLHRNGDSQRFDNGELVTWTDERKGRCYVSNLPAVEPRLDERAIVTVCKPVESPPDGDLVKRAKPRYLRKPDAADSNQTVSSETQAP